jgi:hypothetical protein
VPLLGLFVQRIKLKYTWLNWAVEYPSLLKACCYLGIAGLMGGVFVMHRLFRWFYTPRAKVVTPVPLPVRTEGSQPPTLEHAQSPAM